MVKFLNFLQLYVKMLRNCMLVSLISSLLVNSDVFFTSNHDASPVRIDYFLSKNFFETCVSKSESVYIYKKNTKFISLLLLATFPRSGRRPELPALAERKLIWVVRKKKKQKEKSLT